MKNMMSVILLVLMVGATSYQTALAGKGKPVEFLNPDVPSTSTSPFSKAVRVGNTIYLSGQLGIDPKTGKLVEGGIKAEATQTMNNIKSILTSLGYTTANLVKCTVMLADISEWAAFNEVYITYFTKPYPARSAFGANGLAFGAKVEAECIAAVDG